MKQMQPISPEDLDLTLDEMETIEDIVDAPAASWAECKQARLFKAMVYVLKRRDDPKYTLEKAGKLKMSELDAALRPTSAGGTAAP
jgi:hypothetical protein